MEQFQVLKNTLQYMNWEAKAASYCILKFIYVLLFISITITTIFITITSILLYLRNTWEWRLLGCEMLMWLIFHISILPLVVSVLIMVHI